MRCIGGKLRVVAKRQSAVGLLHDARFGISDAHPFVRGPCRFQRAQLLQFFQRFFQPLLLFTSRSCTRLLFSWTCFFASRIAHFRHPPPRSLQMYLNFVLPMNTSRTRLCPDLRPVLHHLVQRDQPLFAERRQHLREQFVQLLLVPHAKIRQRVVVHFLQPRQPLERGIVLAASRHFPCRTDPLAVGVHP